MSNELDQEQVILKNHVIADSYSIAAMYQQKRLRWKSDLDGFAKSSNLRRANFVIMRRTYRTLNDCEMQHNVPLN